MREPADAEKLQEARSSCLTEHRSSVALQSHRTPTRALAAVGRAGRWSGRGRAQVATCGLREAVRGELVERGGEEREHSGLADAPPGHRGRGALTRAFVTGEGLCRDRRHVDLADVEAE
jgi:hypothetical protein